MKNYKVLTLILGAILLMIATAGTSYYFITKEPEKPKVTVVHQPAAPKAAAVEPAAGACDDGNIAGKVIGGVGGGVLGSNIGKGSGKTAGTIGGTLGGAYLGGKAIPLQNVTCPNK